MKTLIDRYPICWATVVIFVIAAAASLHPFQGALVLCLIPPLLLLQWLIRAASQRFGVRTWVRCTVMMLPALFVFAVALCDCNGFGGRERALARHALSGYLPADISGLRVYHDSWTDEIIVAYFRSDPRSLRKILEHPPFKRSEAQSAPLDKLPIQGWLLDAEVPHPIVYHRQDMPASVGFCRVTTDPDYSFALIEFAVD
jgi:hypothetical protein